MIAGIALDHLLMMRRADKYIAAPQGREQASLISDVKQKIENQDDFE